MSCFFPSLLVEAEACMQGDEAWANPDETRKAMVGRTMENPLFLKHKPFTLWQFNVAIENGHL